MFTFNGTPEDLVKVIIVGCALIFLYKCFNPGNGNGNGGNNGGNRGGYSGGNNNTNNQNNSNNNNPPSGNPQ